MASQLIVYLLVSDRDTGIEGCGISAFFPLYKEQDVADEKEILAAEGKRVPRLYCNLKLCDILPQTYATNI